MKDYVIITDSPSDLSADLLNEIDVTSLGLVCLFKGKEYVDDGGITLKYKDFYEGIRNLEQPTTGQINSYRFAEEFTKHVKERKGIIYIGFSSVLSGTFNSSVMARNEVLEEYPDADITLIDSKAASGGEGLLVYLAARKRQEGCSKEELVSWIEATIPKVNHFFFVDDLNHLKRGGRISSTTAVVGGILNIKPIMYINDAGSLVPFAKAKGRKKATAHLLDDMKKNIVNPEEQTVMVTHSDCLEDAEALAKSIKEIFNVKEVIINYIGTVVGSHTGAGTLALFFLGESREP